MSALLLHPSLAYHGADQGYLKWLHHCGVVWLCGCVAAGWCFTWYFLLIFPGGLLVLAEGRGDIIIAGVLGPGRTGPPVPVLLRCPLCLSVEVISAQTTSDMRNKWEKPRGVTRWTVNCQPPEQPAEDRMSSKISIYIYFTITSLAGDSFIIEIIYRKFRGGKNVLLSCSRNYFILRRYFILL